MLTRVGRDNILLLTLLHKGPVINCDLGWVWKLKAD